MATTTELQLLESLAKIDPMAQEFVKSGNPIQDAVDPIMGQQGIPTTGIDYGSPFKEVGGFEGSGVAPNVHPYPEHLQGIPTTGISHGTPYAEEPGSLFGGIADFFSGDISPEAQAALDQEAGELEMMQNPEYNILPEDAFVDKAGTGYADPPQEVAPELPPEFTDPTQVDPSNPESVGAAVAGQVAVKAKQSGEAMGKWYNDRSLNEGFAPEEEEEIFGLVQGISNFLGEAFTGAGNLLEMGYKGWMSLSPSTRTALVGAAATAWAYNKGWKETAGDTAQAFMGMYSQERQNEVASAEAEVARQAEQQQAITKRQQELADQGTEREFTREQTETKHQNAMELERLKQQLKVQLGTDGTGAGAKLVQQGDIDRAFEQALVFLEDQDSVENWYGGTDKTKLAKLAHKTVSDWTQKIQGGRVTGFNMPYLDFLKQNYSKTKE